MEKLKINALVIMLAAIALLIAGCSQGASSPTDAWKGFYAAAQKKDGATMKSYLSKGILSEAERDAQKENISLDEAIVKEFVPEVAKLSSSTTDEKIDGDKATLRVSRPGDGSSEKLEFVKEDGTWKIAK